MSAIDPTDMVDLIVSKANCDPYPPDIGCESSIMRGIENMLAKLETVYLGILRVIILVLATIALLAAFGALASAIPAIMQQTGLATPAAPSGGTLEEYIAARKATVSLPSSPASAPALSSGPAIEQDSVPVIARNLYAYTKDELALRGRTATVMDIETAVRSQAQNVPLTERAAYFADLEKMSNQLKESAGKKLSLDDIDDLLRWHQRQFLANTGASEGARAEAVAASMLKLYVAGYAFALFILIIFTFLFVKIERSLRVVRVVRVEDGNA